MTACNGLPGGCGKLIGCLDVVNAVGVRVLDDDGGGSSDVSAMI